MWCHNERGEIIWFNLDYIIKMEEWNGLTYVTLLKGTCLVTETAAEILTYKNKRDNPPSRLMIDPNGGISQIL